MRTEALNILAAGGLAKHAEFLWLLAVAVFGGAVMARLCRKVRLPDVVGYIVLGVLIGESCFGLVSLKTVESLDVFNLFVLSIIGFMIGRELRRDVFQKHGKQLFVILLSEGIGAFIVVALSASLVAWKFTGDLRMSLALGLLLGAIASATAPAATASVLWGHKTRGPLTTTILAVVAMDDALALLLYAVASAVAISLTGHEQLGLAMSVLGPIYEIAGAIVLGGGIGFVLGHISRFVKERDKLVFALGVILLVTALSVFLKVGSILTAMALGASFVNFLPRRSKGVFEAVAKSAPPFYVLFFVLAGARTVVTNMGTWVFALATVYLVGRTAGKTVGAWWGAKRSGAPDVVRKYLGMCLLSKAGVAIGLAILASHTFGGSLGQTLVVVVMATTFLLELVGPPFVKLGVKMAGEIGLNITEEDLTEECTVADMMDRDPPVLQAGLTRARVIEMFTKSDTSCYPVLDRANKVVGMVTLDGIKAALSASDLPDGLVLATDIMEPAYDKTTPDRPLAEVMEDMKELDIQAMPVVGAEDDNMVGLLDVAAVNRRLSAEVLRRRQQADGETATST